MLDQTKRCSLITSLSRFSLHPSNSLISRRITSSYSTRITSMMWKLLISGIKISRKLSKEKWNSTWSGVQMESKCHPTWRVYCIRIIQMKTISWKFKELETGKLLWLMKWDRLEYFNIPAIVSHKGILNATQITWIT